MTRHDHAPAGFALAPPSALSRAARAGSRAARGGAAAEDLWDLCHDACLSAGVAFIVRLPVPYVVVRGLGRARFEGQWTGRPGTDYQGVLLDGSHRRVAAEAKSTASDTLDLGAERGGLKPHQCEALTAAHARRHVALVLITFRAAGRLYAVPWDHAERLRTCREADLAPWAVDVGEPYLQRWVRVDR